MWSNPVPVPCSISIKSLVCLSCVNCGQSQRLSSAIKVTQKRKTHEVKTFLQPITCPNGLIFDVAGVFYGGSKLPKAERNKQKQAHK